MTKISTLETRLLLSVLLLLPVGHASMDAAVVNLTNVTVAGVAQSTITTATTTFVGGMIEGALFRRPVEADDSGSGSGVFRDLYRVDSNSGPEAGYNRDAVMDSDVPNGFFPVITMEDLVEDSTHTAYVFVIDSNEPGNATEKFVSLDDFKIYIGGTTEPDPLPQDLSQLGSALGMPVYDMNGSGVQNHVLLDYSLYAGSGEMDMFIFVPKAVFGNAAMDRQVFIYSEFGAYAEVPGFDPAAGPEQVSLPGKAVTGTVDPLLPFVPEPGLPSLIAWAGIAGLCVRHRQHPGGGR